MRLFSFSNTGQYEIKTYNIHNNETGSLYLVLFSVVYAYFSLSSVNRFSNPKVSPTDALWENKSAEGQNE